MLATKCSPPAFCVSLHFFFFGFFFFTPPEAPAEAPGTGDGAGGVAAPEASCKPLVFFSVGRGVGSGVGCLFCIFRMSVRLRTSNRFKKMDELVLNLMH